MINSIQEFYSLIPFIIIGCGILAAVVVEMYSSKSEDILPWFSILVLSASAIYSLYTLNTTGVLLNGMLAVGGNPGIFNFLFTIGATLIVLSSKDYLRKYGSYYGEYYILLLSAVLGMMLMAGARDLFTIFLGLEIMSICFYVLAGINRKKQNANEASLKYFLLGAFATGFIVYGIALIYGSVQSTSISLIVEKLSGQGNSVLFYAGMLLFLIGFSFKIAAFPFHMWVPDVYQGAATTVSALFSTIGKAAAFSVMIIVLGTGLTAVNNVFAPYFSAIAVFSMLYGSIVAISQKNIKRMLAYSSIAHAGYMSIGLAAGNYESAAGIIFYLAAYIFMNIGAFGIVAMVEGENDTKLDIDYYAGLNSRKPVFAALLALFMFALAGIPPMAGFFGKYYMFIAAVHADLTWLAVVGVISSAISAYFYLRIIVLMYFREPESQYEVANSKAGLISVIASAAFVMLFGLFPGTLMDLITSFIK